MTIISSVAGVNPFYRLDDNLFYLQEENGKYFYRESGSNGDAVMPVPGDMLRIYNLPLNIISECNFGKIAVVKWVDPVFGQVGIQIKDKNSGEEYFVSCVDLFKAIEKEKQGNNNLTLRMLPPDTSW